MNTLTFIVLFSFWMALAGPTSTFGFYCPQQGRWVSRDPIGEKGFNDTRKQQEQPQQPNAQSAFLNNPVNVIDLLGLLEFEGCDEAQKQKIRDAFHNACNMPNNKRFQNCLCNKRLNSCLQNKCASSNTKFVCRQDDNGRECRGSPCGFAGPWPTDKTIWLCPNAWNYSKCKWLSCTIIHELTHNCQHIIATENWAQQVEDCVSPQCRGSH